MYYDREINGTELNIKLEVGGSMSGIHASDILQGNDDFCYFFVQINGDIIYQLGILQRTILLYQ